MISWPYGAWHIVRQCSGASAWSLGAEKKNKRQTAVYDSHGQVPFQRTCCRVTARRFRVCCATAIKATLPPGKLPANGRLWQGCEGLSISARSEMPLVDSLRAGSPSCYLRRSQSCFTVGVSSFPILHPSSLLCQELDLNRSLKAAFSRPPISLLPSLYRSQASPPNKSALQTPSWYLLPRGPKLTKKAPA